METPARLAAALLLACAGCTSPGPGGAADLGADGAPPVGATALMARLGGLWSGPAQQTPLGTFPVMNMDLRAADPHVLFGRADLDAGDGLRFAFLVETHGGKDVLVFRNGGYFQGILRDSRAQLIEQKGDVWRFCSIDQGCGYIDARFDLGTAESVLLDVKVRGMQHLLWRAARKEARALPAPFPADDRSQGSGDGPFPPMPALAITVSWGAPLTADADVWCLLSVTECRFTTPGDVGCTISRSISAPAAKGATSASLRIDQVHAGPYKLIAVVDRNRNLKQLLRPDSGDGVSLPNQVITVPATGEGAAVARVVLDLP